MARPLIETGILTADEAKHLTKKDLRLIHKHVLKEVKTNLKIARILRQETKPLVKALGSKHSSGSGNVVPIKKTGA